MEDQTNRLAVQTKHVLGGTFKGALIGGATGAAILGTTATVLGGAAILVGGPFTIIPAAIAAFTPAAGWALGAVASSAIVGASYGATIGAAGGGLWALSGASAAADVEAEKQYERMRQADARQARLSQLAEVRDQQREAMMRQEQQMGVSPAHGLPKARGTGADGHSYTA